MPVQPLNGAQRAAASSAGLVRSLHVAGDRRDQLSDAQLPTDLHLVSAFEIAVAVVDIHDTTYAAVEMWCQKADPAIAFAGGFSTSEAFLGRAPNAPAPDVVVADIPHEGERPDFDGLAQVARADHRVIVYSHFSSTETILRCLEAGAVTYLVKPEGKSHLIEAIRAAGTDDPYIGPRMAQALFDDRRPGRPRQTLRRRSGAARGLRLCGRFRVVDYASRLAPAHEDCPT
jgi:DNA-binding NarL/FixJ family response regulator